MNQDLNKFIETQLNEHQQQAVLQKDGCLLVIAGAGSGKTRVITSRIAQLIVNEHVHASAIVALTFTNKAAKEMQERIEKFLGNHSELPFIGTFHSYCLRLLKTNQHLLDLPFFSIIDTDDQEKILQGIIQRNNLSKQVTAKQILYQISFLKNQAITKEEQKIYFIQNPLLQEFFQAYETEKRLSKCLDFDDLLHYGLKLFADESFKTSFQNSVRHILVDEYQDTNIVQHALLKAMTLKDKKCVADSICVVGDEDQSIYSWRGATVTNMVNFKQDFPETKLIKIEQNYRSVQSILDVANHVIKHNKQRNPKQLWSTKKGINRIGSLTCSSEYQEGDAIAQLCKVIKGSKKLSSCAVLYRTHFQSRAIEEALIKSAIPYKIFGGIQFYERKEIKDLLAYLRLIINPFDRPSFFRIINCPTRGLGTMFEALFYERWSIEPFLTFHQVIEKLIQENAVTGKKAESLQQFAQIFTDLPADITPTKALDAILERSAYVAYIKENFDLEESQGRIDNIDEFRRAIDHFQAEQKALLDQFLQEVALMQEKAHKQKEEQDAILMMTYHAAKGLEFDTVILVGLEEGLLPSSRSVGDSDAVEEERRLFYVGITRAKERLLLSKSRYRYSYGKMNNQMPTRFLKEIPEHLFITHDIGNLQPYMIKQWFAQWLEIDNHQYNEPVLTFGSSTSKPISTSSGSKSSSNKSISTENSSNKRSHDTQSSAATAQNRWRTNQPVAHTTFGIGTVTDIEERNGSTFVTVKFKTGTKKILSSFLQKI